MYIQNPDYKLVYFDFENGTLRASESGIPDLEEDLEIDLSPLFVEADEPVYIELVNKPEETVVSSGDSYDFGGIVVKCKAVDGTVYTITDDDFEESPIVRIAKVNGVDVDAEEARDAEGNALAEDTIVSFDLALDSGAIIKDAFTYKVISQE